MKITLKKILYGFSFLSALSISTVFVSCTNSNKNAQETKKDEQIKTENKNKENPSQQNNQTNNDLSREVQVKGLLLEVKRRLTERISAPQSEVDLYVSAAQDIQKDNENQYSRFVDFLDILNKYKNTGGVHGGVEKIENQMIYWILGDKKRSIPIKGWYSEIKVFVEKLSQEDQNHLTSLFEKLKMHEYMQPDNGRVSTIAFKARALDTITQFFKKVNSQSISSSQEVKELKKALSKQFLKLVLILEQFEADPSPVGSLKFEFADNY
ncbi:LIPOPROTEIN [Mycoplasmopsis pulmonis]|uniref:LIPOPROTEIN n=1 Tax=Mycoplasmopsis pulmonis (strain UAB CTIP) TaxID=272635 RepID=Q98RE2_MYCPU|nr:hypothetical protein [Mycoplasmopsis pulmonis]CAC13240.1 LIPOPROTEIN [Mycoplasmopsis pulmonis]